MPATGLHITSHGYIVVADLGCDMCKVYLAQSGRLHLELEVVPLEEPSSVVSFTTADNKSFYLVAQRSGLHIYTDEGKYLQSFAEKDIRCPQYLSMPLGSQSVLVSDWLEVGSQVMALRLPMWMPKQGAFEYKFQSAPQEFPNSWYVCLTSQSTVIISDKEQHAVKAYTLKGRFLWTAGSPGVAPGQFMQPAGIAEDSLGHILVADSLNNRVQILDHQGKWLGVALSYPTHDIECPMDIEIDLLGNLVVLQACGDVSVYKYINSV